MSASLLAAAPARANDTSAHKNLVVPRDFPTIQAAVNAATSGDTITVKSGMYAEEVVINKDVRLKGAGAGMTTIKSPATLTPYATDLRNGATLTAIVRIGHGAHVDMSGFTVSGAIPCGLVTGVVAVQGATLELSDSRVNDMIPATTTCADPSSGRSVVFGAPDFIQMDGVGGTTASGRVTRVTVDGYQTEGLVATGPSGTASPSTVRFTDNTIIGGSPQIPTSQIGIDVFFGALGRVTGNRVLGAVCTLPVCGPDPISDVQSIGIIVQAPAGHATITHNRVSGAGNGIYQFAGPNCCTIRDNTLKNNVDFGIIIQDGNGRARQNTVIGGRVGIGVVADATNTVGVLRGDDIRGTTVARVSELQCCGFTATAIVKRN